jgi:hypothetical protein
MTEETTGREIVKAAGDCGCAGQRNPAPEGPRLPLDGPRMASRRTFLGRLAALPAVAALARFLPIGGEKGASAAVCYSWRYVGCERYCDCNGSEANAYYVYRRLCIGGGWWYEYYYAGASYCGNYCAPRGAFLGYC